MTDEELTRLEALEQAATPAPWASFADMPNPIYGVASVAGGSDDQIIEICREPEYDERCNDMAFIAAARSALPALIAEVRRLRAWRETVINLYPDIEEVQP
jgi:hypothetical protein